MSERSEIAALAELLALPARVEALTAKVDNIRALLERLQPTAVPVVEAAKALGVSESTVWRGIKRGDIPVIRVGRTVRVDLAAMRSLPEDVARLARGANGGGR